MATDYTTSDITDEEGGFDYPFDGEYTQETRIKNKKWAEDFLAELEAKDKEPEETDSYGSKIASYKTEDSEPKNAHIE